MNIETIELVIRPGPRSPTTKSRGGRYSAVWGKRVMVTAREPFFAAARILVAEGIDPNTVLTMRHEGSQTRSLTMPLGKAAGLMVVDTVLGTPKIVRWSEPPSERLKPLAPQNGEGVAKTAPENSEPGLGALTKRREAAE